MKRVMATSFRITLVASRLLKGLSKKMGIAQSSVLELLIRKEAKKEKLIDNNEGKQD